MYKCSSVQLLGDLLFCISGQSGKKSTESAKDNNFATDEAKLAIFNALFWVRKKEIRF